MLPEYGQLALIFALCLATCLSVIPLVGSFTGRVVWMSMSRPLVTGLFIFVAIAMGILAYSFYTDDFSVSYVANHSNILLPKAYKLSAVWGGHEGSVLLWVFMLTGWAFAVSLSSKNLPIDMLAQVLSVMGIITVGFLLFILLTSNPFDRMLPNVPLDGSDLNPLLQDFGMIIHPPMLYMGYVGSSVTFAFAIAALMSGRFDSAWARWSRPWTNLAWCFLTVGIALGSWWAYYELGWGGWWFWDPVENASFMPWIVSTALVHSLAMSEKRGVFKNWTLLLAIFTFSLSLLGTFLVRSGVLTSVHAFATDPERGVFILGFLFVVVAGSLTLFAARAHVVKSVPLFTLFSREAFLLANSIILVITASVILLGTLYPIFSDALNAGKISVGPPYFNFFFTKTMGLIAALMGLGIMMNWKTTDFAKIRRWQAIPLLFSVALGVVLPAFISDEYSVGAAISITLGSWVFLAVFSDIKRKAQNTDSLVRAMFRLNASYYGMVIAHLGFGLSLLGASLTTIYTLERDVRLTVGQSVDIGKYNYELADVRKERGQNYSADVGEIIVTRNGELVSVLTPEKRKYFSGGNIMTEAAIDAGFTRDIFVALGDKLSNTDWAVRIHYKPFIRWIWLGAIFMALGGVIAITDKRYKLARRRDQALVIKHNGDSETQSSGDMVEGEAVQ
ncbi:MAG: heme lyase NrfEFG subunit NrfE [Alteromonadaceae bacterium]|nr:MAG: heme lyase NrfEFG subunit NrfE [Alteromonadaceae bacterium]